MRRTTHEVQIMKKEKEGDGNLQIYGVGMQTFRKESK